jgi:hypothetical protein
MTHVAYQIWSWNLNGYIDSLINVYSCGQIFVNLRGQEHQQKVSLKEKIKKLKNQKNQNQNIYCQCFTINDNNYP